MLVEPSFMGPRKKRVDVLFFGESPHYTEAEKGQAFVGQSGEAIRMLIEAEIPGLYVCLDNACPEFLGGTVKPNSLKFKEYAEYRQNRVDTLKPRVIVGLGLLAIKAMGCKCTGGVMKRVGDIEEALGHPFVFAHHPASALHDPDKFIHYKKVFRSIRTCLRPKPSPVGFEFLDLKSIRKVLASIATELCAFDLETTGLVPHEGVMLCASISTRTKTYGIPLWHETTWSEAQYNAQWIKGWWNQGPRICHNAKFEMHWLEEHLKCKHPKVVFDTMLQAWAINENEPITLNHQVFQVLQRKPYWDEIDYKDMAGHDIEELMTYCCHDTRCTYDLHMLQQRVLVESQKKCLRKIFLPMTINLMYMERAGIEINIEEIDDQSYKNKRKIQRLKKKLEEFTPELPNLGSPKQLRVFLGEKLGLKLTEKTDKGEYRTDQKTLMKVALSFPRGSTGRKYLEILAETQKLLSYHKRVYQSWPLLAARDNRLHSNLRLGVTVTARLTSNGPNLQNVDRDGPHRVAMISRFKGGKIIQGDYGQHELRSIAASANCIKLLELFKAGTDPHEETAKDLRKLGLDVDRSKAKNINFSVIYDITPIGLHQRYGIPLEEGTGLIQAWHELYPEILVHHKRLDRSMRDNGWVENVFGWRRHLDNPKSGRERRQAHNFPIQSMAVMICYMAINDLMLAYQREHMQSRIILQIHDSIVVDAPRKEIKKAKLLMEEVMLSCDYREFTDDRLPVDIPLEVEVKMGDHF